MGPAARGAARSVAASHHSPPATDPRLLDAVLAVRIRHPDWGAKKLLGVAARRQPQAAWPTRSTVCNRRKTRDFVRPRRRREPTVHVPSPLAPITRVNEVWTTDFRAHFGWAIGRTAIP